MVKVEVSSHLWFNEPVALIHICRSREPADTASRYKYIQAHTTFAEYYTLKKVVN